MAHSELTARQDLGCQDRGDAAQPQGFASFVEILDGFLHSRVHLAVLPLRRPCAQVLGYTEPT